MKRWSILLPYYNEAKFLPKTLEAICAQNYKNFTLILVNNASTDGSEAIAKQVMAHYPHIDVQYIYEEKPGKTNALQSGLAYVTTSYVATMDADTYYPPNYIGFCHYVFERNPNHVAVMACDIYAPFEEYKSQKRCRKAYLKTRIFTSQCHGGGCAQAFRTDSLRQVKGFDQAVWPYMMEDHEIIHRLLKIGKVYYSPKHWCMPSKRRTDTSNMTWTRFEKFLYEFTPYCLKDWYFYSFLGKRFAQRNISITLLRDHTWEKEE